MSPVFLSNDKLLLIIKIIIIAIIIKKWQTNM